MLFNKERNRQYISFISYRTLQLKKKKKRGGGGGGQFPSVIGPYVGVRGKGWV